MAFKKVGARKFVDLKAANEGDVLVEGEYRGQEPGKFGVIHLFRDEAGIDQCLAGGHLNWLVDKANLSQGDLCRVTYSGKIILAKGPMAGKPAHTFELEVDEDYTKPLDKDPKFAAQKIDEASPAADGEDISL